MIRYKKVVTKFECEIEIRRVKAEITSTSDKLKTLSLLVSNNQNKSWREYRTQLKKELEHYETKLDLLQ